MTDNDIIKALKCCVDNGKCKECPINPHYGNYGYCTNLALTYALDLINRQKAEIDELRKSEEIAKQNAVNMARAMPNIAKATRIEAIKEFAGRLRKHLERRTEYDEGGWDMDVLTVTEENIDNLVKEMTENENGNV